MSVGYSTDKQQRKEERMDEQVKDLQGAFEEAQTIATEKPVDPKQEAELEELITFMKKANGYLVTITTLSNGKLNHHLLTKSFPEIDVLKSIGAVEKMAIERLKNL